MDPTKNNGGLTPEQMAALKRVPGQIIIQWDPNTGGLMHESQGVNPIEEIGLLAWCMFRRFGMVNDMFDQKRVKIADPSQMPTPGPKIVS